MSVLTKVFVVLVTVLAVVGATLMMAYVANVNTYKNAYQDQKSVVEAYRKTVNSKEGQIQAMSTSLATMQQQLAQVTRQKDAEVQAAIKDRNAAQADLTVAKAREAELAASVTTIGDTLKQNEQIVKDTLTQLQKTRAQIVDLQTQNIELVSRNNDLDGTRRSLENEARRLKESVAQAQSEYDQLKGKWDKVPGDIKQAIEPGQASASVMKIPAPARLQGQITRVEQVAGETLAQVNIGAADNVQPNMVFVIHRGDKFLGNLVILKTDDRSAVGQVTLAQNGVKAGDAVMGTAQ